MMLEELIRDLKMFKDPAKAKLLAGFFKTGKGEYGEGDLFWGISVPNQRIVAKKYSYLELSEIGILLRSKVHEQRLTALIILVTQYRSGSQTTREKIYNFYLANSNFINNWDLVDLSAPRIVGSFLLDKDKETLVKLAHSKNLWEKRISIISTLAFIKNKNLEITFKISKILLSDKHDLIHKAVGWMLREAGKIDQKSEERFLQKHYSKMPRTMLRYAIEKFDKKRKEFYMRH